MDQKKVDIDTMVWKWDIRAMLCRKGFAVAGPNQDIWGSRFGA